MLILIFIVGFVFSLLTLWDMRSAIRDKSAPFTGLFCSVFSAVIWFVISFIWPASATSEILVPLGWLWIAFGWTFTVVSFTCLFLIFRYSVSGKGKGKLEIREEEPRL